ncbi:phosphoesterase, partial [Streptomyces sp. SID11233]|nr:phosphoesterase [Streptomyces sp. SID11233]
METPRVGIPDHLASRMTMPEQHEYLRRKLSRRSALRAGTVTAGAVAGLGVLGGSANAAQH